MRRPGWFLATKGMRLFASCLLLVSLTFVLAGCGAGPEVIVETADGQRVTVEEIDSDPWALLPSGAVAWADLDAQAVFSSPFGEEVATLLTNWLPVARSAGFDATQDIERIHAGIYATVGSDLAGIARGQFDPEKMKAAVEAEPVGQQGQEITVHPYAGFDVFVLGGAAMVPVTRKTLVFGSQIGVRRVLERIEEGRLKRAVPAWFEEMLASRAPITLGVDLDAQPVPATVRTRLAWLEGLRAGRLLGNFEDPGLNLAGTLTYDQPSSATAAAENVETQAKSLDRYALLMSILRVSRPIHRLEARPTGKNTQVVAEIDGRAIAALLARADQLTGQLFE